MPRGVSEVLFRGAEVDWLLPEAKWPGLPAGITPDNSYASSFGSGGSSLRSKACVAVLEGEPSAAQAAKRSFKCWRGVGGTMHCYSLGLS